MLAISSTIRNLRFGMKDITKRLETKSRPETTDLNLMGRKRTVKQRKGGNPSFSPIGNVQQARFLIGFRRGSLRQHKF
jgi:hypothetical protein